MDRAALRGLVPVLHELVADFVGEDRIVQMHFRQPGNSAHHHVLDAGQSRRGDGNRIPVATQPVVIQTTWISLTAG